MLHLCCSDTSLHLHLLLNFMSFLKKFNVPKMYMSVSFISHTSYEYDAAENDPH